MAKNSTSKGIVKDVAIIIIGIAVIFVILQVVFGFGTNPFYVVASGKYDSRVTSSRHYCGSRKYSI